MKVKTITYSMFFLFFSSSFFSLFFLLLIIDTYLVREKKYVYSWALVGCKYKTKCYFFFLWCCYIIKNRHWKLPVYSTLSIINHMIDTYNNLFSLHSSVLYYVEMITTQSDWHSAHRPMWCKSKRIVQRRAWIVRFCF